MHGGASRGQEFIFCWGGGGGGGIVTRENICLGSKIFKIFRGGGENDPSPATESEKVDGLMIQDTSFLEFIYFIFFLKTEEELQKKEKNKSPI